VVAVKSTLRMTRGLTLRYANDLMTRTVSLVRPAGYQRPSATFRQKRHMASVKGLVVFVKGSKPSEAAIWCCAASVSSWRASRLPIKRGQHEVQLPQDCSCRPAQLAPGPRMYCGCAAFRLSHAVVITPTIFWTCPRTLCTSLLMSDCTKNAWDGLARPATTKAGSQEVFF
jgi:hypothetical protein